MTYSTQIKMEPKLEQELVFRKTNIAYRLDILNGKITNKICLIKEKKKKKKIANQTIPFLNLLNYCYSGVARPATQADKRKCLGNSRKSKHIVILHKP